MAPTLTAIKRQKRLENFELRITSRCAGKWFGRISGINFTSAVIFNS